MMGKRFPYLEAEKIKQMKIDEFKQGREIVLLTNEEEVIYLKRSVEFYHRMGYDYYPDDMPDDYFLAMITSKVRLTKDTATLPGKSGYFGFEARKGVRGWVEEGRGIIVSWKDFERFPWSKIKLDLENHYDFLHEILPEGMKIMISANFYETIQDQFLGYESLSYLLYDDPELVREVSNRWGEVIYDFYENAISREVVGGILRGDDFGHKTGTAVSPDTMRERYGSLGLRNTLP